MAKPRHVIWDWNGTLLNDAECTLMAVNILLKENGLPLLTLEEYRDRLVFPLPKFYEQLGLAFDDERFAVLSQQFIAEYDAHRDRYSLHNSASDLLHKIPASGMTQSILSAYPQDRLEHVVNFHGITGLFSHLTGIVSPVVTSKIEYGKSWLKSTNLDVKDMLMVGDTFHDFEVAQALGVEVVLVAHGYQSKRSLQACGVPVMDSLEDLTEVLF